MKKYLNSLVFTIILRTFANNYNIKTYARKKCHI